MGSINTGCDDYEESAGRIKAMEAIFDRAQALLNAGQERARELADFQPQIRRLEEYYTSKQWKEDFAADEAGKFPADLKRGVLSEDGIYNLLEQNKEVMENIKKGDITRVDNPWKEIPLSDYENHMSLENVSQLQAVNAVMKEQFDMYPATTAMVLGVAGGNGLEHIDKEKYQKVFCVDINPLYIEQAKARHSDLEDVLEFYCLDLVYEAEKLPHADFMMANLVVEYLGYDAFRNVVNVVRPDYVSCVIQIDNDDSFISESPYAHSFDSLEEVHYQLEQSKLTDTLEKAGYHRRDMSEYPLPNGKSLVRIDFKRERITRRK